MPAAPSGVPLTELHDQLAKVLAQVAATGQPVTVLRFGQPYVVIAPPPDLQQSVVPKPGGRP